MNFSVNNALATKLSFDADNMWIQLADGRKLGVPLAFFPRLLEATPKQRDNYVISGGGVGIHWDEIDEDISVRGLLLGLGDQTYPELKDKSRSAA